MKANLISTPTKIRGINVYPFSSPDELIDYADTQKGILVAVNAEKVVNATDELRDIINNNIGYCDGAGAVKAMHRKGRKEACRIPGCELWLKIIDRYHADKSFYLVGARQSVVEAVVAKLRESYPDISIAGYRNGFIPNDAERDALVADIAAKHPDVVFVAMGSPRQELLMSQMKAVHPKAIYQGLGGSFDVMTGRQSRAPRWWREHNLEFAFRFIATPKRIARIKPYLTYACWLYTNKL